MTRFLRTTLILFAGPSLFAGEWRITPDISKTTLVTIQPGPEQWEDIQGNIHRLQIQDADGHSPETRAAKILEGEETQRTVTRFVDGTLLTAKPLPENRLELTCRVPNDSPPVVGLELQTPMKNFERQVQVWGIGEDGAESQLVDAGILIDYSRYANVRNTKVRWNDSRFRTFRLILTGAEESQILATRSHMVRTQNGEDVATETWSNSLQRPLKVDGVTFIAEENVLRKEREVRKTIQTAAWVEKEAEKGVRVFECEVGYQPITHLTFSSSTQVYHRTLHVLISDEFGPDVKWSPLTKRDVFSLSYRTTQESNTTLHFPEETPAAIQVRVETRNRPPLAEVEFALSGPQWGLTFLATPEQEYVLTTSSEPMPPSNSTIRSLLVQGHAPQQIEIGERVATSLAPPSFSLRGLIGSRGFLITSLVVVAMVIGLSLLKAVKNME